MKNNPGCSNSSMLLLLLASNQPSEAKLPYSSKSVFSVSDFEPTGETIFSGSLKNCKIMRDRKNKALYTLKTIPKYSLLSIQATRERIEKAMKIDHPSLLKIHFFLEDSSNFHIFYEHIPGNDLSLEIILEDGLSEKKCLNYFYKISKVVDLLHSHQFILNHLSLENIYFDKYHKLKLAIEFEDKERSEDCMPPEKGRPTHKSDIWCLGIMYSEMIHEYPPEDLGKLNSNMPTFVSDLLSKLLNKNPEKRITSRQLIVHSYFNKKLDQKIIIDRIEKRILRSMSRKKMSRNIEWTNHFTNASTIDDSN